MNFQDKQAIYLQIADRICEFILSKQLKNNERIPSVRDIAIEMEVNPNTANRAFEYLQNKEIIYNKRGLGYFVAEDGYEKTKTHKKEEFMTIDVPDFFKKMDLLEITCEELEIYIEKIKKSNKE